MHYRRLGRTGIKVSEISLGTWITFGKQIDDQSAVKLVNDAYNQGVNYFDNADMYARGKAEEVLGKAVQDLPRETLVLSSKVFFPTFDGPNGRGLSRKHITESLHASLKRMNLNYLDLYFCHRYDPDTTVEEVVQTMDILVRQGKILYWGTSEWDVFHLMQAITFARDNGLIPPVVEQPKYNLFNRRNVEMNLAPLCREYGLGLTAYSPLYYGILTGKYNDGIPADSRAAQADTSWVKERITQKSIKQVRQLTSLAQDLDATTGQLALAWILRRKDISCLVCGATRLEQLDENLAAADLTDQLDNNILEKIDMIFSGE